MHKRALAFLAVAASVARAASSTCSGTACAVNQDAPGWVEIMQNDGTTQVDYFKYQNPGTRVELASGMPFGVTASPGALETTPRPAYTYLLSHVAVSPNANGTAEYGTGTVLRGACNLADQASIFPDYSVHATYPRAKQGRMTTNELCPLGASAGACSLSERWILVGPSEFSTSRLESSVRGMNVWGAFTGNVLSGLTPQGSATEVVYFEDQACAFGGHEYGFYKDAAATLSESPAAVTFYLSDHTNCAPSGLGNCNASDGLHTSRYAAYPITNLSNNSQGLNDYQFAAYFVADSTAPHGYLLRVQIVDPYTSAFETCAGVTATSNVAGVPAPTPVATAPSSTGPCTFDITPPSWFRADVVNAENGYLFAGFLLGGNPDTVGNTPGLSVNSYRIGN